MRVTTTKAVIGTGLIGVSSVYLASNASAATYTGSTVGVNQFGYNISVQISTDANGRITGINTSTPVAPTGQSATIYSRAVGTLQSQAISAQSANITGVSGATYTTSSWKASLASAISQIVVAPAPAPTPAPTQAQPSTPPVVVFPTPTSVQQSVPANSSPAANAVPAPTGTGCATSAPIIMNQPDFTSPPYPSGAPSPYGAPFPSGLPIPISTLRAGENSVVTQQQVYLQLATQNWIQTITKTSAQFQTVTCTVTTTATPTATPTVTVFVTTTPDPAFIIKPGAAVVLKNFICAKTVAGVTSVKVLKAKTIKCPTGYKLAKS